MLAWAVVWKEKRRKETKQKHRPTKKRKQERKRTKHPVHSSQSVEEGGSVSSAFLHCSGHRQLWSSLHCANFSFLQAFCSLDCVMSPVYPWDGSAGPKVVSTPFLLCRCCFRRSECSMASAGCTAPGSSPGMRVWELRSSLGTDRHKVNLPCSKMRSKHWTWGCVGSQHRVVEEPAKYRAWTGASSEPRLRNSGLSAPACEKMLLILHHNSQPENETSVETSLLSEIKKEPVCRVGWLGWVGQLGWNPCCLCCLFWGEEGALWIGSATTASFGRPERWVPTVFLMGENLSFKESFTKPS